MAHKNDVVEKMLAGETLANCRSSVTGSRGNVDVEEFDIVDAAGVIMGTMTVREETDTHHPFNSRRTVTRADK